MLTIGISFAVWNYSFVGSANTIDTEDVSLEFLESNIDIISIENALPISDSDGKAQDETFNFAVTSKASKEINIKYTLKIENLSIDTGYTQLSDDEVKVYLTDYDDNMLVSPVKISDLSNYSLYSKLNSHSKTNTKITDKYKLRVWIDSEVEASKFYDEDANVVKPYQYKFKIGIQSTEEQASASNSVYSWSDSNISLGATLESIIGYTTDYTALGHNYFLKHNIGSDNTVESQEVCYILNSTLYCLKNGSIEYYEENKTILLESFGEGNCSMDSYHVQCSFSNLWVAVWKDDAVLAGDDDNHCGVGFDGSASCYY